MKLPQRTKVMLTVFSTIATMLLLPNIANSQNTDPGLPTVSPELVGMSSERLARIRPAMQKYIDQKLVPGVITLVARKGKVVHFEIQGYMDVDSQTPMRADAMFRIASMTKPITSVALMMLWEEGAFQLRDPVSKFIPEFENQVVSTTSDSSGNTGELIPVNRPATIRDMLTHTAGLANSYRGNTSYYASQIQVFAEDTLESYIGRLAGLPLNYQPGEEWQYSAATTVVGRLVEVISGQTLADFMQERIFEPLAMTDTHFFMDDDKGGRLMSQYTPGPNNNEIVLQDPGSNASRWITSENKRVFRGAGGLVSTTRDYLRFQQAMLNGGELDGARLLSPNTLSLMMENHTGDLPLWLPGPGKGFGLGWAVIEDRGEAATPLTVGSAYWGGAYCTLAWIDREQELIGILMTQVRPYNHMNIRQDFQVLAHQAIID
ncbi:MAG: beta-lactamase family protein [Proteobacteria bacterium]|nr:beta-lactamase family protein [Pseudomonadota bacterium]